MNKITIIGAGQVGSTIAYALTLRQLASEILLIDIDKDRAKGEAMDIYQGTPFLGPVWVHAGDYADAKDSDIVVITSGVGRKPGQSHRRCRIRSPIFTRIRIRRRAHRHQPRHSNSRERYRRKPKN